MAFSRVSRNNCVGNPGGPFPVPRPRSLSWPVHGSLLQLQVVQRAFDPFHSFLSNMRVPFGRLDAAVPQ